MDIFKSRGKANSEIILASVLNYTYKDGALEIIQYLKDQGYRVATISGSFDVLVNQVAKELGIELAAANHGLVFDKKGELIDITTVDRDDQAKLKQLEGLCKKLEIDIAQCACIGDGDNDIRLFEKTGHGITFAGSKIEKSAWKIVDSLDEIKEIL